MKFFNNNKNKGRDPTGTKSRARPASASKILAVEALNKTPDIDRSSQNPQVVADDNPDVFNDDVIQSYELRLEEMSNLMDELSSRSLRLASENKSLREKLSSGFNQSIKPHMESKSPLKSIIKQQKKITVEEQTKLREENSLLHQQAELLVNELTNANSAIGSLEKELKANWENAKKCK
jgi:chromosome segregation ATPase